MESRLPISVCMIATAEAHRIGRALTSVADWAAEIVIVLNQDVADDTESIARKYGAQVFREPWKGHVAQKNSAAAKATQPWVLGLDADEEVSLELREEIRAALNQPARSDAFDAFSFPRLSWYCGRWIRHGDWYPDRKTRLWRRGRGQWAGVDPHDKLEVHGATSKLKCHLRHYSNESIAQQITKIAPYNANAVRQQLASGGSAGIFELVLRPLWRFVRAYFFRFGFLDGWQGFYIAAVSSFSTLTRYAMVREGKEKRSNKP